MPTSVRLACITVVVGLAACRQSGRQAAEDARLARARAAQDDLRAAAERKADDESRARRHVERIARARTLLGSSRSASRCDAALDLGAAGAAEAVPDLLTVLDQATEQASVRACAASALVKLGQVDEALAFYSAQARSGTSEGRRIAISGFREIGRPAAEVALPHLAQALTSPDFAERYVAADVLAELGPSARPLLQQAQRDADERVRHRATTALTLPPR